jgi:hypothetical protein
MNETIDEFHGQGGSYTADPKTGKRTLVSRTLDQAEPVAPADPATDPDQE